MTLSDQLLAAGSEHQLIPCRPERTFVPPMAKINLVDDLDIFALTNYSDRKLIDALNVSSSRSLNIITARTPEAGQLRALLRLSGEISIASLSRPECMEFLQKLVADRGGPAIFNASFLKLFRSQIEMGQFRDPYELNFRAQRLLDDDGRLHYRSNIQDIGLEIVRPKLITVQTSILRRIARHPNELAKLSPIDFERLVGELFEKEGYSVEFTKVSRDGGVDIFAWKRDVAGVSLTIVQCKKHSPENPVRVGVVREVVGSMNIHSATAAAIFTTSYFTKAAADEAMKIRYRLSLNDYFEIMQSIAKHQIHL